jgi:hypothetical protein
LIDIQFFAKAKVKSQFLHFIDLLDEFTVHLKATILLTPNQTLKTTGAPLQKYTTDKKVTDAGLLKILATSLKTKKKKKEGKKKNKKNKKMKLDDTQPKTQEPPKDKDSMDTSA